MGIVGVPLMGTVLMPLAAALVTRVMPETAWDGAMQLVSMGAAALATFLIGISALGLPWVAALIAGFMVGATSYARRIPEPHEGLRPFDEPSPPHHGWEASFESLLSHKRDGNDESAYRQLPNDELCPHCRRSFQRPSQLEQHIAAKHPGVAPET
jgi:predicted membrane channel-forming protein YqfA (hemolysin III family)